MPFLSYFFFIIVKGRNDAISFNYWPNYKLFLYMYVIAYLYVYVLLTYVSIVNFDYDKQIFNSKYVFSKCIFFKSQSDIKYKKLQTIKKAKSIYLHPTMLNILIVRT